MTTGEAIYKYRTKKGMTQEELARAANTTPQNIYKYEKGIVGMVPLFRLQLIAKALDVSPSVLAGWEDENETFGPTESWVDVYTLVSHMPEDEQEALGKRVLAIVRDTPPDAIVDPAVAEIILQLRSAPAAKRRAALAAALAVLKSE